MDTDPLVSISLINNESKEMELFNDDSVPTDLTVSVSGPVQGFNHIEEESDAGDVENEPSNAAETVKRLRSENKFLKLELHQKNARLEKRLDEARREVDSVKQHVHLSNTNIQTLNKENLLLSDKCLQLHIINLRLELCCIISSQCRPFR